MWDEREINPDDSSLGFRGASGCMLVSFYLRMGEDREQRSFQEKTKNVALDM